MFETISKSKSSHEQIEAFNEIQKFVSVSPDSEALHKIFHAFCQSVCVEDDTWSFWREFVTGSMLPYLGLYLSIRSEQWELRLASLKMMAPIFHAFDCSNYINIILNHLAEIQCLPPTHLDHFRNGAFVASIKGNTWSSVALDEIHEMCINKDVKAAIAKLSDDYISKVVHYLPYRAESLKNFQSQLGVFSGIVASNLVSFSSKDDEVAENNIKNPVIAIKGSDLLPLIISENRGLVNVFTKISAKSQVIGTPSADAPVRRKSLKVFKCGKEAEKIQTIKNQKKTKKPFQHVCEKL